MEFRLLGAVEIDDAGRVLTLGPPQQRGFLEALGVPPERMPPDLDARAALYRSLLLGKRILVVLDNARDAEQARPLLPGSRTALTLVTSRSQLLPLIAANSAEPVSLDLMSTVEGRDLLALRLGGERVAEAGAVERIVVACAGLPLALSIAAARALQTGFPLTALAAELAAATGPLEALDAGDPATEVRAVFSWSYTALTPPAARLFRLLGLAPGPDISAPAAASLLGADGVHRLLAELTRANLVAEHAPGRYTLHDLLRAYAADLAGTDDDAFARLFDHYLYTAYAADRLITPSRDEIPLPLAAPAPGTTPAPLAGRTEAMAWLGTERPVLLALVRHGLDPSYDLRLWQLVWTLFTYLNRQGHWHDLTVAARQGLLAAERLGDPGAQAAAHYFLAFADTMLGRHVNAGAHYQHAIDLYGRAGDLVGQANTHNHLGMLSEQRGRTEEALEHAQQALGLFHSAGHRNGQAKALNAVGWCYTLLGDHAQALEHCGRALELFQELGDRETAAASWDSLGHAHHHLGHHAEAVDCYEHALALVRTVDDRYREAIVLDHLGDVRREAGNLAAARADWQQALDLYTALHHADADAVRAKLAQV